jgi:hypothetical protein
MPIYLVSGSAVPTSVTGGVSAVEDAVGGEDDVVVEAATRTPNGDVQFTLRIKALSEEAALEKGGRVASRLSPGSQVTIVTGTEGAS